MCCKHWEPSAHLSSRVPLTRTARAETFSMIPSYLIFLLQKRTVYIAHKIVYLLGRGNAYAYDWGDQIFFQDDPLLRSNMSLSYRGQRLGRAVTLGGFLGWVPRLIEKETMKKYFPRPQSRGQPAPSTFHAALTSCSILFIQHERKKLF